MPNHYIWIKLVHKQQTEQQTKGFSFWYCYQSHIVCMNLVSHHRWLQSNSNFLFIRVHWLHWTFFRIARLYNVTPPRNLVCVWIMLLYAQRYVKFEDLLMCVCIWRWMEYISYSVPGALIFYITVTRKQAKEEIFYFAIWRVHWHRNCQYTRIFGWIGKRTDYMRLWVWYAQLRIITISGRKCLWYLRYFWLD